ncbi:SCO4225 family membrane protein [Streptomyces thermolineatus]|uniref:SCO4225 family membrane protein n=1 Tax=Streptomyces thermolineatus TaxID=44033 RepID=UPI00384AE763
MSGRNTARRIFTAAADNRASRVYLAVCFTLPARVRVDSTFVAHEDASFAGVLPILATAPTSLVLTLLPWESAPASYLVVAASAVVNATLIGLLVRALGRRGATAARA